MALDAISMIAGTRPHLPEAMLLEKWLEKGDVVVDTDTEGALTKFDTIHLQPVFFDPTYGEPDKPRYDKKSKKLIPTHIHDTNDFETRTWLASTLLHEMSHIVRNEGYFGIPFYNKRNAEHRAWSYQITWLQGLASLPNPAGYGQWTPEKRARLQDLIEQAEGGLRDNG